MNDLGLKLRLAVSALVLMVALCGLGMRLAFLQTAQTNNVRTRDFVEKIIAGRGRICDRNGVGNVLALNLAVKDVCVDPSAVVKSGKVVETAVALAETLDLPIDNVAVKLNKDNKRFSFVKRFVLEDNYNAILAQNLDGVFLKDSTVRHYPNGNFLCHVLGFVNYEGVGSAGIEQRVDSYLRGSPGLLEGHLNAYRQELYSKRDRYVPALEGGDVVLNIDQNIQYITEMALDEMMKKNSTKAAWAIVERVKTGEILAMASRPSYDPNDFRHASSSAKLNRTIGVVYEPGSTFKAGVIAAAINEGLVTTNTLVDCENGAWSYAGRILHDSHKHGKLTVADVLKKSSNIGAAKIALMLGEDRLYEYMRGFGIGCKTGIDLPGEENGIFSPCSKWSKLSCTRIPIGQGVAVTALQMLNEYCCIANGGFMMRPYVISKIKDSNGSVILDSHPSIISQPITQKTADIMRILLHRVTEDGGTGRRARVDGYKVAGKTGTAQKPVDGRYSTSANMASFVGFIPAEAPEIAVIVVADEPQPFHTGGAVAAPAFSQIAGETARYLEVPPFRDMHNKVRALGQLARNNTGIRE